MIPQYMEDRLWGSYVKDSRRYYHTLVINSQHKTEIMAAENVLIENIGFQYTGHWLCCLKRTVEM